MDAKLGYVRNLLCPELGLGCENHWVFNYILLVFGVVYKIVLCQKMLFSWYLGRVGYLGCMYNWVELRTGVVLGCEVGLGVWLCWEQKFCSELPMCQDLFLFVSCAQRAITNPRVQACAREE